MFNLPLIRYEQQPGVGLAVRKYVLHKRGKLTSAAQRKPGSATPDFATLIRATGQDGKKS